MTVRISRNSAEGILTLPSELLNNIFQYLNLKTLEKMSLVCFAWNEHLKAQELLLLKGIISKKFDIPRTRLNMITTAEAAKIFNAQLAKERKNTRLLLEVERGRQSNAITHKICQCEQLTDDILEAYLQLHPQADTFSVTYTYFFTDEMFAVIARKWTHLKTFELHTPSGDLPFLQFTVFAQFTVRSVLEIIKNCSIVSLVLEKCFSNPVDYEKIFASTHKLRLCKFSSPVNGDHTIAVLLKNNCHLRSLELGGCKELTDKTLNNIGKYGKKMKNLRLHEESLFSQKAIIAMLESLPKLKMFDLFLFSSLTDQDVLSIATAIPKIKKLKLRGWEVSKVSTVVTLGKLCPHLEFLSLDVIKPKKSLFSAMTVFSKIERSLGREISAHQTYFKNLLYCNVNYKKVFINARLSKKIQ